MEKHKSKISFRGPDDKLVEFIIEAVEWTLTRTDDTFTIIADGVRLDFPYPWHEFIPMHADA